MHRRNNQLLAPQTTQEKDTSLASLAVASMSRIWLSLPAHLDAHISDLLSEAKIETRIVNL